MHLLDGCNGALEYYDIYRPEFMLSGQRIEVRPHKHFRKHISQHHGVEFAEIFP